MRTPGQTRQKAAAGPVFRRRCPVPRASPTVVLSAWPPVSDGRQGLIARECAPLSVAEGSRQAVAFRDGDPVTCAQAIEHLAELRAAAYRGADPVGEDAVAVRRLLIVPLMLVAAAALQDLDCVICQWIATDLLLYLPSHLGLITY